MINAILITVVCIALALSLFIGVYALFRSQSSKRNYFLLMQTLIIVYLAGYLLELTSTMVGEAFTAVRVLYIGGFFVAPLALFFVADYCNIKIHPLFVKTPMLLLSLASVLAMWTTNIHGLVYVDYSFDRAVTNHLVFTPGLLYYLMRVFPIFCMFMTLAILLSRIRKWKNKYRKRLLIFLYCALIPSVSETAYLISIIAGINIHHINFTPHSLAAMSFFLYLGVMRFNIFEIISSATVSAMDYIKEGFILVDDDNNYLSSNPAALEMFPDITHLSKGVAVFYLRDWPEELETTENGSVEFSIKGKELKYFRASVSPVYTKSQALVAKIIIFSDTTDSVILMKELESAASNDGLTGLYNRKHFSQLADADIKRAFRMKQSVYAGLLDIDYFKKINDTYGHHAGDIVLKETAGIIRQTIRSYDLVGRYGGEEFSFLISDMEPREVLKLVERIRENMEKHGTAYEGKTIKATCSIGLTKFVEGDTLESALKKADVALYAAKNAGRNQVKICSLLIQSCTTQELPWP